MFFQECLRRRSGGQSLRSKGKEDGGDVTGSRIPVPEVPAIPIVRPRDPGTDRGVVLSCHIRSLMSAFSLS